MSETKKTLRLEDCPQPTIESMKLDLDRVIQHANRIGWDHGDVSRELAELRKEFLLLRDEWIEQANAYKESLVANGDFPGAAAARHLTDLFKQEVKKIRWPKRRQEPAAPTPPEPADRKMEPDEIICTGDTYITNEGGTVRRDCSFPHYRITLTPKADMSERLQIEEGAYYKNRRGEKIGPMDHTPQHKDWPWVCWDSRQSFTRDGSFDKASHSDFDLIAPWNDAPTPPEPPAVPELREVVERVFGMNKTEPAAPAVEASVDPNSCEYFFNDETVVDKDDICKHVDDTRWKPVPPQWIGSPSYYYSRFEFLRRRIPAPVQEAPSVDLWSHERDEYRKAIEGYKTMLQGMGVIRDELTAERDKLTLELAEAKSNLISVAYQRTVYENALRGAIEERDEWKNAVLHYACSPDLEHDGTPRGIVDALVELISTETETKLRAERDKLRAELAAMTVEKYYG